MFSVFFLSPCHPFRIASTTQFLNGQHHLTTYLGRPLSLALPFPQADRVSTCDAAMWVPHPPLYPHPTEIPVCSQVASRLWHGLDLHGTSGPSQASKQARSIIHKPRHDPKGDMTEGGGLVRPSLALIDFIDFEIIQEGRNLKMISTLVWNTTPCLSHPVPARPSVSIKSHVGYQIIQVS